MRMIMSQTLSQPDELQYPKNVIVALVFEDHRFAQVLKSAILRVAKIL